MQVEIRGEGEAYTVDLPCLPADGDSISRYDGATETIVRVVGRPRWVLDAGAEPLAILRVQRTDDLRAVRRISEI